jgi:hypothetical protein
MYTLYEIYESGTNERYIFEILYGDPSTNHD